MKVMKIQEGATKTEFSIEINPLTCKYEFKVNGMLIAESTDYEALRALAVQDLGDQDAVQVRDMSKLH